MKRTTFDVKEATKWWHRLRIEILIHCFFRELFDFYGLSFSFIVCHFDLTNDVFIHCLTFIGWDFHPGLSILFIDCVYRFRLSSDIFLWRMMFSLIVWLFIDWHFYSRLSFAFIEWWFENIICEMRFSFIVRRFRLTTDTLMECFRSSFDGIVWRMMFSFVVSRFRSTIS
jgi:hypothetical protein